MVTFRKTAAMVLLCAIMLLGLTTAVSAEKHTLPDKFLIVDNQGITASPIDGVYYVKIDNMRPGELYSKKIHLQNMDTGSAFRLYMRAEPVSRSGNIDMFELTTLTLSLNGNQFFTGSPNGTGNIDMKGKVVDLGAFKTGQQKSLDMTALLDGASVQGDDEGSIDFRWIFWAVREPTNDRPKTGLDTKLTYGAIVMAAAMVLLAAVLVLLKKEKDKKAQVNADAANGEVDSR